MKLSIVIPVYNEKDTLLKLLEEVRAVEGLEKEIIIVEDFSTDGTREIVQKLAGEGMGKDLKIVYHEKNMGKGASLRDGFKVTTGDYVIVQDADLEYTPSDYHKLLNSLENGTDVVYGSRFSGTYEDMSSLHYVGNRLLTFITNLLFGVALTDMETCYKLVPGDFVRNLEIKSARFNFEPEITAKILKAGLHIREVPIKYKGRSFTEGKKITWKDGIVALFTLIKFRFFD